jgi:tetratricopeptide (TPR) repeat protein
VQDVVSMAALLAHFCRIFRMPDCALCAHKTDQIGLSSWFHRAGQPDEAIRCLERAVLLCREPDEEHALSMHVATIYKRLGRWEDAVDIWRERARIARGLLRVRPCVELAKYYEHRAKEADKALEWARRALTFVEARRDLQGWNDPAGEASLEYDGAKGKGRKGKRGGEKAVVAEGELEALLKRLRRLEKKQ